MWTHFSYKTYNLPLNSASMKRNSIPLWQKAHEWQQQKRLLCCVVFSTMKPNTTHSLHWSFCSFLNFLNYFVCYEVAIYLFCVPFVLFGHCNPAHLVLQSGEIWKVRDNRMTVRDDVASQSLFLWWSWHTASSVCVCVVLCISLCVSICVQSGRWPRIKGFTVAKFTLSSHIIVS